MFECFELHFIGKSPFTRQQLLTLQIAVHHDNCSSIVVKITNDNRHGFLARQLRRMMPPVSRNQLIAAVRVRTRNRGDKHAILAHAVHCVLHRRIVLNLEGMISERMQLTQRDFLHLFPLGIRSAFFRRKKVIDRFQLDVSGAAFHAESPLSSAHCTPARPCPSDHTRRCFFLRCCIPPP